MRVVSLLPSATEILCHLGGGDLLVGRSHECDFPPGLARLPALTSQSTAYDPASGVGAAEIDAEVRRQRAAGGALYRLDVDRLVELDPDVILTQDICDVCSVDLPTVQRAAAAIAERGGHTPAIITLNPETVEDVFDDLLRAASAVGLERAGEEGVVALRGRLHTASEVVNPYADGPVVGLMEWTEPVFVAGHWNVQLIERAGGYHPWNPTKAKPGSGAAVGPQMAERVAGRSIAVAPELFAAARPEALVVAPCGLTLPQAEHELRRLMTHDWFRELPAVRSGRVAAVDGSAMFNRPGPRLVDAFEWLCAWLNDRPERTPSGFPWTPIDRVMESAS